MCNQHTMVLFLLPIIGWVLATLGLRKELTFSRFLSLALFFFAGLLPYAHLACASTYNLQRGSWGDLSTFDGFIRHLRRADYGTFRLYVTDKKTAGMVERLQLYAKDFAVEQSFYVGPTLAIGGMLASILGITTRGRASESAPEIGESSQDKVKVQTEDCGTRTNSQMPRTVTLMIIGAYLFYMIVFHYLANLPIDEGLLYGVQARFWQQPNTITFLWAGIGLAWVSHCTSLHAHETFLNLYRSAILNFSSTNKVLAKLFHKLHFPYLAHFLAAALVIVQVTRSYQKMDMHSNDFILRYARSIAQSLPKKSLWLTNYDQQWTSFRYLQACESFRPDISFLSVSIV